MLNILRSKKFAKWTLMAVLVLIIPAFVIWGSGDIASRPKPIGTINKKPVLIEDLTKSMQGIKIDLLFRFYGNYDALNKVLQNRPLMTQMSWQRLIQLEAAKEKKIKINDRDVLGYLASNPVFQKNGFFDQYLYMYVIKNNLAMEPRQFEELIRENLMIQVFLMTYVLNNITVPEEDIKNAFANENTKIDISYALVDKKDFIKDISVGQEEIKKYYNEHSSEFRSLPKSELEYISLPYDTLKQKQAAAKKVEDLLSALKSSKNKMQALAEKEKLSYSKTGPISQKTDLIPGIKYSEDLYKTVFALKPGETASPLFGEGVIYLFRKIDDIAPKTLSIKEVEKDIIAALQEKQAEALAIKKAENIIKGMTEKNIKFEDAIKAENLTLKTNVNTTVKDYIENIGQAEAVVSLASRSEAGKILAPIAAAKGAAMIRVDKITRPTDKEFEAQKSTVYMNLLMDKQRDAIKKWLDEKAPKATFAKNLEEI